MGIPVKSLNNVFLLLTSFCVISFFPAKAFPNQFQIGESLQSKTTEKPFHSGSIPESSDSSASRLQQETADQTIAEHATFVTLAIGSMLISQSEARRVNRLSHHNKTLERQAQHAESLEQFSSLKKNHRQNRQQMARMNQHILFWDSLTLAALGFEGYLIQRDVNFAHLQKTWIEQVWHPLISIHPIFQPDHSSATVSLNWTW